MERPKLCGEQRALIINSDTRNMEETPPGCLCPKNHEGKHDPRPECGRAAGLCQRCLPPKNLQEERFPHWTAVGFLPALAELTLCIASSCKMLKR